MELEAESKAQRTWTPVLQVPEETVAIATFQWKRVPLTKGVVLRLLAIAVAIVIVCGVIAFGVSAIGPKTYGARSEILYPLNAEIASGSMLREDRTLSTQMVAIKSRTVLNPVATSYGLTFDELSKKVSTSVLQDSEVIRIQVDDGDQALAMKLVTDITNAYLKNASTGTNNAEVEENLRQQINQIDVQRRTTTAQLGDLVAERQASANPNTPTPQELLLQADLDDLTQQRSTLQNQLSEKTIQDLQTPGVQPLTQPYEVGKVAPKPLRAGIAGALAGIMIAAGVVVLLLRRRLRQLPLDQFG